MGDSYQKLKNHIKLISDLSKGAGTIAWDMDVMMPPYAATERGEVLSALAGVIHEKQTDPTIKEYIVLSENEVHTDWDRRNLQLIKESYALMQQVPEDLVHKIQIAMTKTTQLWENGKDKNDWDSVQPALDELFQLQKEQSKIFGGVLGLSPYDAQLSISARGNSQAVIDPLFDMLQKQLPSLLQEIIEKQKSQPQPKPFSIPIETQQKIVRSIIGKIGYDFNRGRLDISMHPASYGTINDSRITTRYNEQKPLLAIIGAIHETGHALYVQNLPQEWDGQPVGDATDMSIHESQSLIMERHVGLSDEFIECISEAINKNGIESDPKNLKAILHEVKPSFIRFEADEVTYPLHVMIRYEIEKALYNGDIKIADLPDIWNQKMKAYLGLEVKEHRLGCLQDIHWYNGMFGYFPTYTQGALYAAQIFDAAKREIINLSQQIKSAELSSFNQFLNENIHSYGQLYDGPQLIKHATGHAPNAQHFLDHLKNRYL